MLALLDGPSQDALEEVADEPLPGSLVVLACRVPALAVHAAAALGRRMLGSTAARQDIVRYAPAAERWTVDEVEQVAARIALMPDTRHFLIVERADAIDQRAFDRLLRIVEEPPAPLTLVLCVPDASTVPDTMLGRASTVLTIFPADRDAQISALVDAGASVSAAREAVTLAGTHVHLALPLALHPQLRPTVKALVVPRFTPDTPVTDALTRLQLAASLAHAIEQDDPAATTPRRYDELTPSGKLAARDLLRLFVEHRRTALVGVLGRLDGTGLETVVTCLSALDAFETRLRRNVPPALALAALASESPTLRLRG